MTISLTTLVVLTANSLTAIVAAALLMLVLWQAPHHRANQLFALAMLMLGVYSALNGLGRFIDTLDLDPVVTTRLATMFYGFFVVMIFFFASEYAQNHTRTTRLMRMIGVVLVIVLNIGLWTGYITTNIRPAPSGDGSYQQDFTVWGHLASLTTIAYLIATSVILYRMPNERGRALWPAPLLAVGAALAVVIIWPIVQIPLNAVLLAFSAAALGLPVLRYELFNPLAELNQQLEDKNRELQEASRLKSQFLANMSHELRTPLNSIIGYTELVVSGMYGALNDTQADRLYKVIRNSHHLLSLINDVLDLNRIESGRITLEKRSLVLDDVIESVLTTLEPQAAERGLTIVREFAGAPPIYADEMRVRQIMTNILANAVKFTHQGSITVRAAATDNHMVQVEVQDTGIGIEPDKLDAVFAEFQQVDSSTTRRYEGTGLGMAITKRLVELHDGTIWLESTPGEGTTVFFRLPVADPLHQIIPAIEPGARGSGMVLCIDDNTEALEMLTDTLTQAGYRVVTAQSGSEGLRRAREIHPDIITLDIMMPGADGWMVLRALKDEPETRDIPVVIVSIIDNRPLALSLGANDALTKPLDADKLLSALSRALIEARGDRPILVVDDQPDDRDVICTVLTHKGYPVECVPGGKEALRWLATHLPSLILLDLMMPEMSGFDVLAHMRSDERLAAIPVIVITGKDLTDNEQEFLRQRCADLVQKGFAGPDVLLRAIEKALVKRQAGVVSESS